MGKPCGTLSSCSAPHFSSECGLGSRTLYLGFIPVLMGHPWPQTKASRPPSALQRSVSTDQTKPEMVAITSEPGFVQAGRLPCHFLAVCLEENAEPFLGLAGHCCWLPGLPVLCSAGPARALVTSTLWGSPGSCLGVAPPLELPERWSPPASEAPRGSFPTEVCTETRLSSGSTT